MQRHWTADERIDLINHYAPEGAVSIAARLGRSADSVSSQARRHGLRTPDYRKREAFRRSATSQTVNTRFFEGDPTQTMAFVLGYIWSCGSVKRKHRHVLRVICAGDERYKIERIRRLLGSRHCIQVYRDRYVLEVSNHRLVNSLVSRFGIPPSQSTDGDPPLLADGLVAGFAGGYLLGSGSRMDAYLRWRGHPSVIQWLAKKIVKLVGVPEPLFSTKTRRHAILWRHDSAVEAINSWLGGKFQ